MHFRGRFNRCVKRFVSVVAVLMILAATAAAQSDLGTIRGVVSDQSGAVVPNAKVVVVNVDTNISREVTTTEQGDFEIPFVVQGTYRLTASGQGFKNFVANDILIRAREVRRIDPKLELGAVGTEITVSEGIAVIATEGSQITGGFNREKFVDSPLSQSFFPQAYMTTLPNIQTPQGGWGLRFAGQPSTQIAQNMDGVTNDGANNLVQNMQDFEDLQVVAVNNSAEFSRVAQFSMVSKGGGNQFHGRAYYDLINSALNARSFFEARKTPYKEHRGGANISGPIIRDKLFFYAGYSLTRIPSQSFNLRDVPTTQMRNGDFSAFLNQASPVTIRDPLTNQPFPGNIIPAARISSVSQKIQDLYIPQPNRGTGSSTFQNFGFLHPFPTDLYRWDSITTRIDYTLNPKDQIFGRFINRITPYVLVGSFPDLGTWTRARNHWSTVLNHTHTFSASIVNSFHWGWAHDRFVDGEASGGFTPQMADTAINAIGLQGVNPQGFSVMGFPTVTILGVQQLRSNVGGVNLNRNDQEFSENLTWATGRHVVKLGGELRYFHDQPQGIPADTFGNFNFNGSLTGLGYSDFLLGLPFSSARVNALTDRLQTAYELGFYVHDTYKLNQRLTLDLGLRWDYFRHSLYEDGLQFNWDPTTGNVIVPQDALSKVSPLYPSTIKVVAGNPFPNPARDNFRPRFGVAYRITDKFVVRGGYGMYTETLGNLHRAQGTGPFVIGEQYFNQVVDGRAFLSFPNPFPSTLATAVIPSQSITGYPTDTNNGIIHQFNLSVERQLPFSIGTRVSYIGSRSRGMNYTIGNINKPQPSLTPFTANRRPWPQFVNAGYTYADGRANYDALQFEIQKQAGAVILNAHYTFSNSMLNYSNLENPYNHDLWNRDAYNSRHRFVVNATYNLPFGKGKAFLNQSPRIVDAALGGWQLGWITYLQSGQYFTPSYSGADPSNTNTFGGLPDRIADGNLPRDERAPGRWFDPTAFVPPAPGRYGNSGAAILEGPGLNLHHLSAIKRFNITERVNFVLQGNFTNIFNTPHFDWPNANISVPASVGRVFQLREGLGGREQSGPRQVQFRFRVEF
jgi:hypothetical protein